MEMFLGPSNSHIPVKTVASGSSQHKLILDPLNLTIQKYHEKIASFISLVYS